MAEVEELRTAGPGQRVNDDAAVATLIARAGRLTRSEARAIASAAAWQWQPLTLPIRGSFVAARSEALAAARAAGRGVLAVGAMEDAARAALDSAAGGSIGGPWSSAENGIAAVLIGGMLAIVGATNGLLPLAFGAGLLAVVGGVALLCYDSARLTRRRLAAAVGSAALALVVRDLVSAETVEMLRGPWSTVMHD